jgi:acetyl-CoA C-acetyltransferase
VTLEAYTVMHDREGRPDNAIAACLTPDGGRVWGLSRDGDLLAAMRTDELVGAPGTLRGEGQLTLA